MGSDPNEENRGFEYFLQGNDAMPREDSGLLKSEPVLPEAGGVAWVDLYGYSIDKETGEKHVIKIGITSRAENSLRALQDLLTTMAVAKNDYKMSPYPLFAKQTPGHQPAAQPAPTQAPVGGPVAPQLPLAQRTEAVTSAIPSVPAAPAAQPAAPENGTLNVKKIVITPQTGGKSRVDFFCEGRKYADIVSIRTPEQLAQMMQTTGAWQVDHFKEAAEYPVNYLVQWRNSEKRNSNGQPYKDIVGISPA